MIAHRKIPVAAPVLRGREKEYVIDCLESNWISSNGKYVERFESEFARFCGVKHAISCCNGTVALHVALLAAGIGPGDEVLIPTLTFIATANAVAYCGATPVLVDSEPEGWNIDPVKAGDRITSRTKAIVPVHLYGLPCDMESIRTLAERHGLIVIEDAAEAHGAMYKGRKVGGIGNAGIFSFYGNKIITTGEGGMIVTDDDQLAGRARMLKGQGMDPQRRYWFPIVGYNYRMTNIAAAIGLGQLEQIDWHLQRHSELAQWYQEALAGVPGVVLQNVPHDRVHSYWMFTLMLPPDFRASRDATIGELARVGIETRPVFYPMHVLPPYEKDLARAKFPVADEIALRGLNLPTWSGLTRDDVDYVCSHVRSLLRV